MNSEKNQLLFIAMTILLILVPVVIFLFVGGNFEFLIIHFSAAGFLRKHLWVVPPILLLGQQLYVIPSFMRGYWTAFSEEPPNILDLYLPIYNEAAVYESNLLEKIVYILWGCIFLLVVFVYTPILQILNSGDSINSMSFYCLLLAFFLYMAICFIRGVKYLAVRRNIYDYHNKHLGIRGTSPFFLVYKMMYFIPIVRSLALLSEIQILDKLTKFNDVENMDVELKEEIK
jgi:hypothetical protein